MTVDLTKARELADFVEQGTLPHRHTMYETLRALADEVELQEKLLVLMRKEVEEWTALAPETAAELTRLRSPEYQREVVRAFSEWMKRRSPRNLADQLARWPGTPETEGSA